MSEKQTITSDNAGELMGEMWAEMGRSLQGLAIEAAAAGDWKSALELGRAADVCIWQATGEGDVTFLKDILK